MKTKVECLSKAKKSQWFKILMAHKPHRDKKVSRKRRGRDGRKHMAWAYWWLGLNSLLSVGLCQLEPPKQEIVPVHWWKESVVFLLFPLLPLVWFRLNSLPRSCLPTPELQFFIVFLFFRIPPFNPWGFLHWARSAQLCWAALWSYYEHHSFCQAPLCFPCISFCC